MDQSRIIHSIARTVSVSSAEKWGNQSDRAMRSLAEDAEIWPEADEAASLDRDLRFRTIGRRRHVYRILFTLDDKTVTVHRIMHAAQDWLTEDDL
jgi:plasmid stabilization system protein ParE